ncbi:MAG: hypothetical protein JNK87_02420 [Bryobacterales bacterium]|nr:hypothetical protein [Bryobacterales bacterium]
MDQAVQSFAELAARVLVFAPLLVAALLMIRNPSDCLKFLSQAALEIEQLIQDPLFSSQDPAPDTARTRSFVRFAGLALASFCLANLLGLGRP